MLVEVFSYFSGGFSTAHSRHVHIHQYELEAGSAHSLPNRISLNYINSLCSVCCTYYCILHIYLEFVLKDNFHCIEIEVLIVDYENLVISDPSTQESLHHGFDILYRM